jgi:hypothetical protein
MVVLASRLQGAPQLAITGVGVGELDLSKLVEKTLRQEALRATFLVSGIFSTPRCPLF